MASKTFDYDIIFFDFTLANHYISILLRKYFDIPFLFLIPETFDEYNTIVNEKCKNKRILILGDNKYIDKVITLSSSCLLICKENPDSERIKIKKCSFINSNSQRWFYYECMKNYKMKIRHHEELLVNHLINSEQKDKSRLDSALKLYFENKPKALIKIYSLQEYKNIVDISFKEYRQYLINYIGFTPYYEIKHLIIDNIEDDDNKEDKDYEKQQEKIDIRISYIHNSPRDCEKLWAREEAEQSNSGIGIAIRYNKDHNLTHICLATTEESKYNATKLCRILFDREEEYIKCGGTEKSAHATMKNAFIPFISQLLKTK